MIKRIIFDLDNTLIGWKDEYFNTVDETFKEFNIICDEKIKFDFIDAKNDYENSVIRFDVNEMNDFISKRINIKLPVGFIDSWKKRLSLCVLDRDLELIKTIKYLYSKYELYVATNWFTDQQIERLKNANIVQYFKEVIGCDKFNMKPDVEMYKYLMGDCINSEVIVIGDSYIHDIEPAIKLGIYSYHITDEIKKTKDNLYGTINSINDLKNIL